MQTNMYRRRYVLSVTSSIPTLHVHVQKRRHVGVQIGQAGTLGQQGGSGMRAPAGFLSKVTLTCRQLPKNGQIHQRQRSITIHYTDSGQGSIMWNKMAEQLDFIVSRYSTC